GIETAEELLNTSQEELVSIKGLGSKTVEKIIAVVEEAVKNREAEIEASREAAQSEAASSEDYDESEDGETEKDIEFSEDEIIDDIVQEQNE
ncbi:MAG: hypothetical protein KAT54_04780, partial [Candidatus Marinimicrobia bacterium]|nr:hypothetical protein [Candidatus Neomarinimicrobiota bacterium]